MINQYNENGEHHGYWETYYPNGNLESKGYYINGLRDGYFEWYFSNGNLGFKAFYINDVINGYYEDYYSNGNLSSKGFTKKNQDYGPLFTYSLLTKKLTKISFYII